MRKLVPLMLIVAVALGATAEARRAVSPVIVTFGGGVVVYRADGSVEATELATLRTKSLDSGSPDVSVRYRSVINVCTHRLRLTKVIRPNVEYAFTVRSLTGNCIPRPEHYRLYWLDSERVALQLNYPTGLTISGLLFRGRRGS